MIPLQHDRNQTTSIQLHTELTPASPFVLASLPLWRKSAPLSRSLVCIPVDIHTHPLLQRNVSYFWAPKVSQTSSLFLILDSHDHCVFSLSLLGGHCKFCSPPRIYKVLLFCALKSKAGLLYDFSGIQFHEVHVIKHCTYR